MGVTGLNRESFARYRAFISDMVKTALHSLWSNRQRSFLTSVGVVAGCMTFVASYGIMWGKFNYDLGRLRRLGATQVRVSASHGLLAEHAAEIAVDLPQVVNYSPVYAAQSTIATPLASQLVPVSAGEATMQTVFDLRTQEGRFFSTAEARSAAGVCVVGAAVARALRLRFFNGEAPVVQLFSRPFRVVGVMEARKGRMEGCGEFDDCVLVPALSLREIEPGSALFSITFQVRSEKDVPAVVEGVRFRLRRIFAQSVLEADAFRIWQGAEIIERMQHELERGAVVIMGIVFLNLLVAGIGLMNIMLVTVVERTREIGLRKAVGARPFEILLQFLVEALCLCLAGGVVGTSIGVVVARWVVGMLAAGVDPYLPPGIIALSLVFAVATGVVFGFAPAYKAAKLNPIEALRRE